MCSAICNGVESVRATYVRCPKCGRRRRATVYERYDSSIIRCSRGHTFVTGDPDGGHYAGKFLVRKVAGAAGVRG